MPNWHLWLAQNGRGKPCVRHGGYPPLSVRSIPLVEGETLGLRKFRVYTT